ncbi:SDR family NAD(P)-dependent oxidoreductase [Caulobacter sp. SLTY]|uniref:SDR family NAD(P)-dependent oxidoreductase n=1 Tax=Caulobacter sp. SLTY TaxID=2683262 RepID=UPI0014126E48|nr:SDR family NAD(P)-dependent oxidoreductase [Caulobacter sp. SLTY]NBB17160.1 SDR family NAD(P)-dependent oxidoreductase [Caulobacter sp. SLTY]
MTLSGKIALVTGATRGIGNAAALGLAKAGAHVIALGRTQGALEVLDDEILAATGQRATLVPIDLRKPEDLDPLGAHLHERFGRLDIVVHAAALLGGISPIGHIEPKSWDQTLTVNLTATWRLIRSFEPLLRASEAGRAIFLTTGRVVRPKAFWGPYAASKAGMEALVKCWADELEQTSVRAVLLDPGAVRTRMRAEAYPGEDPLTLPEPAALAPLIVELAGRADLPAMPETVVFNA